MKMKVIGFGSLAFIVILVSVLIIGQKQNFVEYKIDIPKDKHLSITVNDQPEVCEGGLEDPMIPEQFQFVGENDHLQLFLEEETIGLMVRDKCNGYTWYSYDVKRDLHEEGYSSEIINYIKGGLSLITYDKFTTNRRTVLDPMVEKTYVYNDDGFEAFIDFKAQQIKFKLEVSIQGGDLIVHIPRESIEEYNPKLWKSGNDNISMNEIVVYPFFGATTSKENGYIVIPDGPGAIVNLSESPKYTASYSEPVYGTDMGYELDRRTNKKGLTLKPIERITLPLYGMIHEADQAGFLVIAEDGASYAKYNYHSRDLTTNYYQSFFSYIYRKDYAQFQSRVSEDQYILGFQEEPNDFDLTQRYVFLSKGEANYANLAKKYRRYLEKKDGFKSNDSFTYDKIPMKIDFINQEVAMGTLGRESVSITSYSQAQEIIKKMVNQGYDHLNVTFKTFIQKKQGYHFDILKSLGGKEAFEQAVSYFEAHNIPFNYYIDYAQSYYEKTKYTASKMNRQAFEVYQPAKDIMNFMNNPKYYHTFAQNDAISLQKYNVKSLALAGLNNSLFTHFDKGDIRSSVEGMEYIKGLLKEFQEKDIRTSVYSPDAYLYSLMDEYYHTPLHSSDMMFVDETIPLIPLILSGHKTMYSRYMNFSSDDTESILKLIEYGVYPSFIMTGESSYELKKTASNDIYLSEMKYLKDRIQSYYSTINEALSKVIGSEMINHEVLEKGIVKVEYDNGVVFIINYTNKDFLYENELIQAKGFVIL